MRTICEATTLPKCRVLSQAYYIGNCRLGSGEVPDGGSAENGVHRGLFMPPGDAVWGGEGRGRSGQGVGQGGVTWDGWSTWVH